MSDNVILDVKNLCFSYYKKPLCLKDVSFSIEKGKNYLLCGVAESGKTTFLKVISGFQEGYFGKITYNGKELKHVLDNEKNFSFLPSEPIFFNSKSIRKNIDFQTKTLGRENLTEKELNDLLLLFNIEKSEKTKVKKLSLLEKRKLALARSYIKNSSIIFVDDPFVNLSDEECNKLNKCLELFFDNKNISVFMTSGNESYLKNKNLIESLELKNIFFLSLSNVYKYKNIEAMIEDAKTAEVMQFANNRKKYVGYISVKNGEYFYVKENVRFVKFDKKYNKIFDKLKIQENGDEDVWLFAKNDVDLWKLNDIDFNLLLEKNEILIFLTLDLSRLL